MAVKRGHFGRHSAFVPLSLVALVASLQLTDAGCSGKPSCTQKRHGSSVHLRALSELSEYAGMTMSTCLQTLPAMFLRSRDAERHQSVLVCSKAKTALGALRQILSACSNEGETNNRSHDPKKENDSSYSSEAEDDRTSVNSLHEVSETLAICCGTSGVVSPKNGSGTLAGAVDCLFERSFTRSLGQTYIDLIMRKVTHCNTTDRDAALADASWADDIANVTHVEEDANTDASQDPFRRAVRSLRWLIANLRDTGNQALTELRRSLVSLRALESSLSIPACVAFDWVNVSETPLLLCNAITDRRRVCIGVCKKHSFLIQSLSYFVNVSKIPVLGALKEALSLCSTHGAGEEECIVPTPGKTPHGYALQRRNRPAKLRKESHTIAGGFCFYPGCKFPLIATTERRHWLKHQQDDLRIIYKDIRKAFPGTALPLNSSLWPCGHDCRLSGFSDNDRATISRLTVGVCGLVTVIVALLFTVVFICNRQELCSNFIYRLLFCFTATSGLENVAYMITLFGHRHYICYSDGVLVRDQPGDKPACGFVGWFSHFFSVVSMGYFALLTYSWQELARDIDKPSFGRAKQESTRWGNYRRDILALVVVCVPAVGLTTGAIVMQSYDGLASVGMCSLDVHHGGWSYFFASYALLVLTPSVVFLQRGIFYLRKHRASAQKAGKIIKRMSTMSVLSSSSGSGSVKALRELTKRLVFYMIFLLVTFVVHAWIGVYILIVSDENSIELQLRSHQTCIMTSCEPSSCPPPPENSLPLNIALSVIVMLGVVILSSWAFCPRLLKNTLCVGALVRAVPTDKREKNSLRSMSSHDTSSTLTLTNIPAVNVASTTASTEHLASA